MLYNNVRILFVIVLQKNKICFWSSPIILNPKTKLAIKRAEKLIKNQGRLLVRKSGTEPKIRIMGESTNKKLLQKCIQIIKQSLKTNWNLNLKY